MRFNLTASPALLLRVLGLITLLGIALIRILYFSPYPHGDGVEYVLQTEAMFRHGNPDIRLADVEGFRTDFTVLRPWDSIRKPEAFDVMAHYLGQIEQTSFGGIYATHGGEHYGYHFFAYSLLNVPMRALLDVWGQNPLAAFEWTNFFILIFAMGWLLLGAKLPLWEAFLLAGLFYFSGVFYYLAWSHPELFTACFVLVGLVLFHRERYHLGILMVSIAALQNQPLLLLVVFLGTVAWQKNGFRIKAGLWIALSGILVLWPPLFYYFHFGTTNLIKDAGYLDPGNFSWVRLRGFFFDWNQGMVLGLGAVVPVYFGLLVLEGVRLIRKKVQLHFWHFLPLVMLGITVVVTFMEVWSHSMAIAGRYTVWVGVLVLFHFWILVCSYKGWWPKMLAMVCMVSQGVFIWALSPINRFDWSATDHLPIAKYWLANHPEFYAPDPQIFVSRTLHEFQWGEDMSPVIYFVHPDRIGKVAVHQSHLEELGAYGIAPEKQAQIAKMPSTRGWVYLNHWQEWSSMGDGAVYAKMRRSKLEQKERLIRGSEQWLRNIEIKAQEKGISRDSAVALDAAYLLEMEEKNNSH